MSEESAFSKADCIHMYNLIQQKLNRCEWVIQNSSNELAITKAERSKKIFRPISKKLEDRIGSESNETIHSNVGGW